MLRFVFVIFFQVIFSKFLQNKNLRPFEMNTVFRTHWNITTNSWKQNKKNVIKYAFSILTL